MPLYTIDLGEYREGRRAREHGHTEVTNRALEHQQSPRVPRDLRAPSSEVMPMISRARLRSPVRNRHQIHREPNRDQRGGDLIVMPYHLERDMYHRETTTQTNGHMELREYPTHGALKWYGPLKPLT